MENSKIIDSFRDENEFLSNFYELPFVYKGLTYNNAEAAFQAQKVIDDKPMQEMFTELTGPQAKKLGKRVKLRPDWEDVKISIMKDIVYEKFNQNASISAALLATDDAELVEGNTWGDTFWGVCKGRGENWLGKILMEVRNRLNATVDNLKQISYIGFTLLANDPNSAVKGFMDIDKDTASWYMLVGIRSKYVDELFSVYDTSMLPNRTLLELVDYRYDWNVYPFTTDNRYTWIRLHFLMPHDEPINYSQYIDAWGENDKIEKLLLERLAQFSDHLTTNLELGKYCTPFCSFINIDEAIRYGYALLSKLNAWVLGNDNNNHYIHYHDNDNTFVKLRTESIRGIIDAIENKHFNEDNTE